MQEHDSITVVQDAELEVITGGAPADPLTSALGDLVKLTDGLAQQGEAVTKSLIRWFF